MQATSTPEHLVAVAEQWSVWRVVCVRGTGFPVSLLEPLHSQLAARAVDALLACSADVDRARRAAIEATELAWQSSEGQARRQLGRTLAKLRAGRVPSPPADPRAAAAIAPLSKAAESCADAQRAVEAAFEAERVRIGRALRELAADPRFREAVLWQNPQAVETGLDALLRKPAGLADKDTRQKELLVARYAQRYCVKNDSVGFFGPVGWGRVDPDEPHFALRPGAELTTAPVVYLETWAVEALAGALNAIPGIKLWTWPRRWPLVRVEGTTLHTPFGPSELSPLEARILTACDGGTPAATIVEELSQQGHSREEVLATLGELEKRSLLRLRIDVHNTALHYDLALRADLTKIGDDSVREAALAMLDRLVSARDEVAAARGPEAIQGRLQALDRVFTELTAQQPTRSPGQTYAGRTLVLPLCRRNVDLALGRGFMSRLTSAVEPLLTAARWWSFHVAAAVAREMHTIFEEVVSGRSERSVDLAVAWPRVMGLFPRTGGNYGPSIQQVIAEYHGKWRAALQAPDEARRVDLSSAALASRVAELFRAPGPGWPMARYHSPDVLVAARSAEAIARGDCLPVIGELHTFTNTIQQLPFMRTSPDPERILRAMEADLPSGRLTPATLKISHSASFTNHPKDVAVEHDMSRSWRARSQVFPIAELMVVEIEGELAIRSRDGRRCWSIAAALDSLLSDFNIGILGDREHDPRITIDGVVVARETWRLPAAALAPTRAPTPLARFIACRAWAAERGFPRHCFFKSDTEKKPAYLDFDSPVFVENFAKAVARAERITMSEMLPTPQESWLADAEGRRYTAELRMVYVDRQPYAARRWER